MDNTREKLIELVDEAEEHSAYICVQTRECEDCPGRKYGNKCREYLKADHLIANGVVVLPCNIGDDIYLIPTYGGKPYCGVVEDKVQMIGVTSRGFHIKARRHKDHNKTYFLGKSAFLTKEEAKAHLPEPPKGE